jgi:hypothetical protein
VPGELINKVGKLPGVTLAPVLPGSFFIEFRTFQDPKNPLDKCVREAVSLADDRRAMNQAETAGMGKPTGNWINARHDPGAVARPPRGHPARDRLVDDVRTRP